MVISRIRCNSYLFPQILVGKSQRWKTGKWDVKIFVILSMDHYIIMFPNYTAIIQINTRTFYRRGTNRGLTK